MTTNGSDVDEKSDIFPRRQPDTDGKTSHDEHVEDTASTDYFASADFKARERRVVRKLDLYIAPLLGIFQLLSYLDRSNIGFAATQGMIEDLNLAESDLNVGVSIFYVTYVLSELPISMYAKKWHFERVLPILTLGFGLITLGSGWVTNYAGLIGTRLALGWFEGCLFPAMALFILDYYKREELAFRYVFLFGAVAISGAFGGLLAYAIYHMDGACGIAGWRWIYIIEGTITIAWGLACFVLVPSSYETAFFLNEDDKEVMRHRAQQTHRFNGGTGEFTFADIGIAAKDIKTWIHGLLQFCVITPIYGFNAFLPIIIKDGLGYDTLATQYLTIPVQLWGFLTYLLLAYLSDRYQKRYIFLITFTPITAAGYILLLCPLPAGAHYFATFVITTGCNILAGNNLAWASANTAPDAKRAATLGIVLTFTDCAGVVIGQLYRSEWAPRYWVGNSWTLGVLVAACGLFTWVVGIYKRRNAGKVGREAEAEGEGKWTDRADDFVYQW